MFFFFNCHILFFVQVARLLVGYKEADSICLEGKLLEFFVQLLWFKVLTAELITLENE